MIWRWLTLFSFSLSACLASNVTGTVQVTAENGKPVTKDLSETIVWLEPAGNTDPVAGEKPVHVRMLQRDKRFTPHVLAVRTGTIVDFPNADPIFHNAFSNFDGQIFDIGLYPPGTSRSLRFRRAGIVRVFCNIHSSMSAVIVVLDTPYFASTDVEGHYQIPNVPAGRYRLHVFYERATQEVLDGLQRDVEVNRASESMDPLSISEAGYLTVTHLNKYGKPYAPPPANPGAYPGGRP
jgi:plastocyanin